MCPPNHVPFESKASIADPSRASFAFRVGYDPFIPGLLASMACYLSIPGRLSIHPSWAGNLSIHPGPAIYLSIYLSLACDLSIHHWPAIYPSIPGRLSIILHTDLQIRVNVSLVFTRGAAAIPHTSSLVFAVPLQYPSSICPLVSPPLSHPLHPS